MRLLLTLLLISLGLSTAVGTAAPDKAQEIERLRKKAQALFDAKQYDNAFALCEQILVLDPYDQTARKQQEEINRIRDAAIRAKREEQNGDEGLIRPTQPPQPLRSSPIRSK